MKAQKPSAEQLFEIFYKDAKKKYFGTPNPNYVKRISSREHLQVPIKGGTLHFMLWYGNDNKTIVLEIRERCSSICTQLVNAWIYNGENFTEAKNFVLPMDDIEAASQFFLPFIIKQYYFYEQWFRYNPDNNGLQFGYRVTVNDGHSFIPLANLVFDGEAFEVEKYYDPPPGLNIPPNVQRFGKKLNTE